MSVLSLRQDQYGGKIGERTRDLPITDSVGLLLTLLTISPPSPGPSLSFSILLGWALEHLPAELTGEGSAGVGEIEWVVLPGEEQGSDLGGRVGVRGCSMGDEGGDAAVVAENGSVVAVAILKTVSGATGCKADCCTGTDTVLISMSVFLFVVLEEVIAFKWQKNKEIRKEKRGVSRSRL